MQHGRRLARGRRPVLIMLMVVSAVGLLLITGLTPASSPSGPTACRSPPDFVPYSTTDPSSDIPLVVHQSWKFHDLTKGTSKSTARIYKPLHETFLDKFPSWEHKLWDDDENRALVAEHYPWFSATYDAMPTGIMRADAMRAVYLHRYGGLYADLDSMPVQGGDQVIASLQRSQARDEAGKAAPTIWVAMMGTAQSARSTQNDGHHIPNALMASTKGHQFWLFYLAVIMQNVKWLNRSSWLLRSKDGTYAEDITGPVALRCAIDGYFGKDAQGGVIRAGRWNGGETYRSPYNADYMVVVRPGVWYPVVWFETVPSQCDPADPSFSAGGCAGMYPSAELITFWSNVR